jgi:hypothetical protein
MIPENSIPVIATCAGYTLALAVLPGYETEGRFPAVCLDTGETLWINGWLFEFEPIEEGAQCGLL